MATLRRRTQPVRPTIGGQAPGRSDTVGEFIVEQIQAGVDPITAAGTCGILPAEFQAWMREGATTYARLGAGADWRKDFTPDQQDAALFAEAVVRARSNHIARLSLIAEQGARGGAVKRTTRTRSVGGQPVEVVETVETALPDLDMVRWKLEKLEPAVYGSKATLNVNVTDLTDTESVADTVGARMREIAKRLGTIETTATEDTPT